MSWWADELMISGELMKWCADDLVSWWTSDLMTRWSDDLVSGWTGELVNWWANDLVGWWDNVQKTLYMSAIAAILCIIIKFLPHLLQMLLFSHPVLSHVPLSHLSLSPQSRFFFWSVELKVKHLNSIQFQPGLLRSVLWFWHLSLHMCLMIVCRRVIFHLNRRGQLSTQVLKSPRSTRMT